MKIPIRYFAERGIQEEKAEDFKDSFFSDVYRQAFDAIASVIQKGRIKNKGTEIDAFAYDVQNTVAFMGRRGTGKTSAMLSVFNALQSNRRTDLSFCLPMTERIINSTEFVALPRVIDASHLEESEDLLEVILACMLKEIVKKTEDKSFDETVYGDKAADLQNRIATMQNHYDSLLASKDHSVPTSYMQLRKSAEKHNIQNAFYRIIEDYLSLMACGRSADSSFGVSGRRIFVICVDDIDMYPGDPMQIMQCIYRYFTLPNLLVLTSMNYNLLYQYIYRHYSDRLKDKDTLGFRRYSGYSDQLEDIFVMKDSERERLCREQSNDYLSKIIPLDLRIVMPSWRKSDYRDICTKTVQLMDHDQFLSRNDQKPGMDLLFPRLKPGRVYNNLLRLSKKEQETDREITVKQLLFQLLADRLGIYLNANGYKHHFMEPKGLRSTFELFDTLYLMQNFRSESHADEFKYSNPDIHNKIRENYKIILDTFYTKILPDLQLNDEESKLFTEFCEITPSRRGKFIIDKYRDIIDESHSFREFYRDDREPRENSDNDPPRKDDYSIGELFRVIHHASRENVFTKSIVKAVLASFSFILPYYWDEGMFKYYNLYSSTPVDKRGSLDPFDSSKSKTLFEIFGGSLLGDWAREMFGGKNLHATVTISNSKSFSDNVHNLLKLLMFVRLDDLKESSALNIKTVILGKDDKGTIEGAITLLYSLDPTAVLINMIRIHEFCEKIKELIGIKKEDESEIMLRLKKEIDSFERPFESFCKPQIDEATNSLAYPFLPFPIHQFDLAYSVVKRAVRDIVYISDNTLTSKSNPKTNEDIKITLERFYQKLFEELKEAQECYPVYNNPDDSSKDLTNRCRFAKEFAACGEKLRLWKTITIKQGNGEDDIIELENVMKLGNEIEWSIGEQEPEGENAVGAQKPDDKNEVKTMIDILLSHMNENPQNKPAARKKPRNSAKKPS